MENTATLAHKWMKLREEIPSLESELEKKKKTLSVLQQNGKDGLYAEQVDRIVVIDSEIKNEGETLSTKKNELTQVKAELIERFKLTNTKTIRIPSKHNQVMDTEIALGEDGELESYGRM